MKIRQKNVFRKPMPVPMPMLQAAASSVTTFLIICCSDPGSRCVTAPVRAR